MKTMFYPRLAWDGIRKNRKMAFPYILTCICMIAMFYILAFLSSPEIVSILPIGGTTVAQIMTLGCVVIAVFSMIFLFYTNSFLIRRRAGEFGLYNVLGMGKGNLVRIITIENLITAAISIFFGLFTGIVLSKLAELGLVKIIGGTVSYAFRVDTGGVKYTLIFYLVIFAVIWFFSVIRVRRSSAVSLLKSDKAGEKAPRANWLLGILGALILGVAYYIAVSIESPLKALLWFFLAVVMVIVATYLLMIAGSVLLCRLLQKNKKYYYDPRHFVSVSSMVYRMKRNGAGLASIAIMATMVLVLISTVSCLWFGTGDLLKNRFPGEINFTMRSYDDGLFGEEKVDVYRKIIEDFGKEHKLETEKALDLSYAEASAWAEGDTLDLGYRADDLSALDRVRNVYFIPLSVYNRDTGENITLNAGEALVFTTGCSTESDSLELVCGGRSISYRLLDAGGKGFYAAKNLGSVVPHIYLVVSDLDDVMKAFGEPTEDEGEILSFVWQYSIDLKSAAMSSEDYISGVKEAVYAAVETDPEEELYYSFYAEERERESGEFMAVTGSLFFIGIMLSVVFILAAVLIIYYKQISEGYEDCRRFEVMRKVGMTGKEIKTSINSQLLVVFFIPLLFAGLHLAFAFPMIEKMLKLFDLYNTGLFIFTTLISYAVFTLFYIIVYKLTSNVYYRIVTEAK